MAPKRKSDVLLESLDDAVAVHTAAVEGVEGAPPAKQPRVGDAADAPSASTSKAKKSKAKGKAKDTDADDEGKTKHWSEVKLDGEDEVSVYSSTNTRPRRVSTRLGRVNARITAYVLLPGRCSSVVSTVHANDASKSHCMGPISDDCNDIRRKIRTLMQEPGFKVRHALYPIPMNIVLITHIQITAWLRDIGNINNNSYQRFSTCHLLLVSRLYILLICQ